MYTRTHTHTNTSYTHREICNHVLEGKKLIKRFTSTKSEEKPQKVLIIAAFGADDKKA